jgi:hypothetical protein
MLPPKAMLRYSLFPFAQEEPGCSFFNVVTENRVDEKFHVDKTERFTAIDESLSTIGFCHFDLF